MNRRASGFTLMEILIVVAIIAVLAGVGLNYYGDYIEDARMATARNNLKVVRDAISRYFKDHMAYPTALNSLQGPYLQQPPTSLLLDPLAGNGKIKVEYNTSADGVDHFDRVYAWDYIENVSNKQIRNIRIEYNGTEMSW